MFENRQELITRLPNYKDNKEKGALSIIKGKFSILTKGVLFLLLLSLFTQGISYNYKKSTIEPSNSLLSPPHSKDQSLEEIITTLNPNVIEDPTILSLINLAKDSPAAKDILAYLDFYPTELLELAANKPETIDFVAHYISHTFLDDTPHSISIEEDYATGEIPLFLQWDERWGYENYGNDFIAINGCGPTSLSMVLVGLTGDTTMHPKAIADFSFQNGYLVEGQGSSWTLMSEGAEQLGLTSEVLPLSKSVIYSKLKQGHPIIASMGPGDFTSAGHFIVLAGVTDNGKIIVNDSDSLLRSQKAWDLETIMSQTKNLWAFSL